MDSILNLDYRLFESLNAWAGRNGLVDGGIIFFAHWAVFVLAAGLVLWWFFNGDKLRTRQALFQAFASFVVARLGITELIRLFAPRARPFVFHQAVQLIVPDGAKSFPSGHAAALFAIATAIYFYNKKAGGWLFALAIIVSVARVAAGVHYPLDILGGAAVGIATARIIEKLFRAKLPNVSGKLSEISDKILPFTKG